MNVSSAQEAANDVTKTGLTRGGGRWRASRLAPLPSPCLPLASPYVLSSARQARSTCVQVRAVDLRHRPAAPRCPKVRHAVSCPAQGPATCPNMTTSAVPFRAWLVAIQRRRSALLTACSGSQGPSRAGNFPNTHDVTDPPRAPDKPSVCVGSHLPFASADRF